MTGAPQEPSIIWATRGRNWGFRFLLKGGLADPLPAYERAFDQLKDVPSFWRRDRTRAALRFPDPEGRTDAAGRVIPHEFVIVGIPTGELGVVRRSPALGVVEGCGRLRVGLGSGSAPEGRGFPLLLSPRQLFAGRCRPFHALQSPWAGSTARLGPAF